MRDWFTRTKILGCNQTRMHAGYKFKHFKASGIPQNSFDDARTSMEPGRQRFWKQRYFGNSGILETAVFWKQRYFGTAVFWKQRYFGTAVFWNSGILEQRYFGTAVFWKQRYFGNSGILEPPSEFFHPITSRNSVNCPQPHVFPYK